MDIFPFIIFVACILVPSLEISVATNYSVSVLQSISDGETLVSKNGVFELGFFSPANSKSRYLGIWYKIIPIQEAVWVANWENPINDSSGNLTLSSTGNLVLTQNGSVIWYTIATSQKQARNPVAELMDTGNLVVRDEGEATQEEDYLWQSFDFPFDTLLPGMKLGWNLRTGLEQKITAWKSPDDPTPGNISWGLVLNNYPEFYVFNGTKRYCRIGPWNGLRFSGLSDQEPYPFYEFKYFAKNDPMFVSNKSEMFYTYTLKNSSVMAKFKILGATFQTHVWVDSISSWSVYQTLPRETDKCDMYGLCGAYGNCQDSVCQCLKGFGPKSPQEWNSFNWSQGCMRKTPLYCKDNNHNTDGFLKYVGMKVPDTTHTWVDETIGLDECKVKCLNNCSCMAYATSNLTGDGSGCVIWFDNLFDMKQFQTGGQDLYIRMPASELDNHHGRIKSFLIATIVAAISGILLFCIFVIWRIRRNIADKSSRKDSIEMHLKDVDLPLFDLLTIVTATNNFSLNHKIGQGGFGPVYKGKLADGKEIAVKRLSRSSGQGMNEFITEVKLIAKLQHRNLVKLLGCCIRGEEKLLVYEYMVNGSLDSFIFDQTKGKLLDWRQRFHIIFGVARGLMYLHQDSRLRIIHRDLKASNVLLDDKLNPKISDFGMARVFGGDQTEGNTNRVVGTYGYMAPEYAVDGLFSIKSDVFSFGILLLEIICGNKNRALCHRNRTLNLVGYAWTLWTEGNALQLIDSSIKDSCVVSEVLQCIHVSLLCLQQFPEDRPTMTTVVQMLGSETKLVKPKEPGFFPRKTSDEGNLSSNQNEMTSNDELTITSLNGR